MWRWDQDQASFLVFLQHYCKIRACTGNILVRFSIRQRLWQLRLASLCTSGERYSLVFSTMHLSSDSRWTSNAQFHFIGVWVARTLVLWGIICKIFIKQLRQSNYGRAINIEMGTKEVLTVKYLYMASVDKLELLPSIRVTWKYCLKGNNLNFIM